MNCLDDEDALNFYLFKIDLNLITCFVELIQIKFNLN